MTVLELDARTIRDCVQAFTWDPSRAIRTYANGEIRVDKWTKTFFSYGSHFPLAHYSAGEGRNQRPLWIVNGDRWRGNRSRTSDHQTETRAAIERSQVPSIVIPFSALAGAEIILDSIRPIHIRDDKQWTESHDLPSDAPNLLDLASADRMKEEDQRTNVDYRGNPCATFGVWRRTYEWRRNGDRYSVSVCRGRHVYNADHPQGGWVYADSWDEPVSTDHYLNGNALAFNDPRGFHWTSHHHRLGDSLFSAQRQRRDGTQTPRARFLSSFDVNENPPLYFLAQVPRGAGETVESALDALAPTAVHAAIARGRRVYRQGDIFYVETDQTRETLARAGATFARLTLWTRDAKPRADEIGGHAKPSAPEMRRRAKRASSYRRRLWREWFHAQIPADHGPLTRKGKRRESATARARAESSVSSARATLRGLTFGAEQRSRFGRVDRYYGLSLVQSQRRALAQRVIGARSDYERALDDLQRARAYRGFERDRYRIHSAPAQTLWTRASDAARERYYPETRVDRTETRRQRARRAVSIYGTAHTATELAHAHGATYARGIARHVPALDAGASWTDQNRNADHAPIQLGNGDHWFLTLRNRVPRDV